MLEQSNVHLIIMACGRLDALVEDTVQIIIDRKLGGCIQSGRIRYVDAAAIINFSLGLAGDEALVG